MKVSWVGLGKLGLPCAVSAALRGHDVLGYDVDDKQMSYKPRTYQEAGPNGGLTNFNAYLNACHPDSNEQLVGIKLIPGTLAFASDLVEVCAHGDIIFVAVQTPHEQKFEGITPLSYEPDSVDFDYSYLIDACERIRRISSRVRNGVTVAIISTVLPGTLRRDILRIFSGTPYRVAYNPSFIAMSTTMRDYLDPEFVLVGTEPLDEISRSRLANYYESLFQGETEAGLRFMSIESAELTKVAYNCSISTKISVANTVMEICHKIPQADVDDVCNAMMAATRRLASPAYMRGGMGDSGGCHPRDNIAMSWLAKHLNLSHNLFDDVMYCRDDQAHWLARLVVSECTDRDLDCGIFGTAYKPNTSIMTGSAAILVANWLRKSYGYEPMLVDKDHHVVASLPPRVWLVGCAHDGVDRVKWPTGSVVIDPFRIIPDREGVKVIRIGEEQRQLTLTIEED